MKPPTARPLAPRTEEDRANRAPRAFAADSAELAPDPPEDEKLPVDPAPRAFANRASIWRRLASGAFGILVAAVLGIAADRLIADLFARAPWLGWAGLVVLGILLLAILALIGREMMALRRLKRIDGLRADATRAVRDDDAKLARHVIEAVGGLYAGRADMATPLSDVRSATADMFDGEEQLAYAERRLMPALDARARAAIAASSRRVALVTAVSPRALVDIGFVLYESIRLVGFLSRLYAGRPGMIGGWRLARAILAHLAVTGGLVLTEGVVEQLVGQGLAARLSARLGEGVVNGLMTVRVGIAAILVLRPLPFTVTDQPLVRDFLPELVKVSQKET
jgi:putative membrane protein